MQNACRAQILPASNTSNTMCESFGTAKTGQTETKLGFLKEHKGRMSNRFWDYFEGVAFARVYASEFVKISHLHKAF